jgi:hypothetical protein
MSPRKLVRFRGASSRIRPLIAALVVIGMIVPSMASARAIQSSADVYDFFGAQQPGASSLVRTNKGISFSFGTSGTGVEWFPDFAFTLWVVIFNFPENCQVPWACGEHDVFVEPGPPGTDIFFGAGNVTGASGTIHLGGSLKTRDESHFPGFGPGFLNPRTAEVHLVLRSHGPKVPANMPDQINSYAGGCVDFIGPPGPPEVADEEGECADTQFSIHPSPIAP